MSQISWRRNGRFQAGPGRLTLADQEEITVGLHAGQSFTVIAARLGKAVSTVSREVGHRGSRCGPCCGAYIDPRKARVTVAAWCATWLEGYGTHRPSTVRQAQVHIRRIVMEFGPYPLGSLRPSQIRSWMTRLGEEGLEDSYIYALHARLAQIMNDAVYDGLLAKSPCSGRTSPHMAQQRVYVATTGQVWELYDLFCERIRLAVLLGAFVGLRLGEACGLRPEDVDFMRAVIHPRVQYQAEELKTKISRMPVPIPASLVAELSAHIARYGRHGTVLTGEDGRQLSPWAVERAMRTARKKVPGL